MLVGYHAFRRAQGTDIAMTSKTTPPTAAECTTLVKMVQDHPVVARCVTGTAASLRGVLLLMNQRPLLVTSLLLVLLSQVVPALVAWLIEGRFSIDLPPQIRKLDSIGHELPVLGPLLLIAGYATVFSAAAFLAGALLWLALAVVTMATVGHLTSKVEEALGNPPRRVAPLMMAGVIGRMMLRVIVGAALWGLVRKLSPGLLRVPVDIFVLGLLWADQLLDLPLTRRGLSWPARLVFLRQHAPECCGLLLLGIPFIDFIPLWLGQLAFCLLSVGATVLCDAVCPSVVVGFVDLDSDLPQVIRLSINALNACGLRPGARPGRAGAATPGRRRGPAQGLRA
jgi:hypothetical protein